MEYLTVKQAAELLKVPINRIYYMMRSGALRGTKVLDKSVVYKQEVYDIKKKDDEFNIFYIPIKLYAKIEGIHIETARYRVKAGKLESIVKGKVRYVRRG